MANRKMKFYVSGIEVKLHLEPIMVLKGHSLFGYEVLSRAVNKGIYDYERLFISLSDTEHMALLKWQLTFLLEWQSCYVSSRGDKLHFFINIRRSLLRMPLLSLLIPYSQQLSIALEIDERDGDDFSEYELAILLYCQQLGITLWLDDSHAIRDLHPVWDGVKLDKQVFWSLFEEARPSLDLWMKNNSGRQLLIEGVVHQGHLDWISRYPVSLGQGHYWPSSL